MEAKIQKWGNSDGIRIPSSILKSLNIKTNDIINIDDDKLNKNEKEYIDENTKTKI